MGEREEFDTVIKSIIDRLENIQYVGDFSDIGNEVGISIGTFLTTNKREQLGMGFVEDFLSGFKHGISLSNGTH